MAKVIDAVLAGRGSFEGKLYFFKDDRYLRVDWSTGVVEAIEPLSAWAFPAPFDRGIDAACNVQGKAYFFKGSQYIRYDWGSEKPDVGPAAIRQWKVTSNVTAPFAAGIDCALEGGPGFEQWLYLFKANSYIRCRMSDGFAEVTKDASGTPYTLQTGWNLSSGFRNQLDAAVNDKRTPTRDAYFYAGNQFVRYNWTNNTCDAPVSFASWNRPASWLLPAAVAASAGSTVATDGPGKPPPAYANLGQPIIDLLYRSRTTLFSADTQKAGTLWQMLDAWLTNSSLGLTNAQLQTLVQVVNGSKENGLWPTIWKLVGIYSYGSSWGIEYHDNGITPKSIVESDNFAEDLIQSLVRKEHGNTKHTWYRCLLAPSGMPGMHSGVDDGEGYHNLHWDGSNPAYGKNVFGRATYNPVALWQHLKDIGWKPPFLAPLSGGDPLKQLQPYPFFSIDGLRYQSDRIGMIARGEKSNPLVHDRARMTTATTAGDAAVAEYSKLLADARPLAASTIDPKPKDVDSLVARFTDVQAHVLSALGGLFDYLSGRRATRRCQKSVGIRQQRWRCLDRRPCARHRDGHLLGPRQDAKAGGDAVARPDCRTAASGLQPNFARDLARGRASVFDRLPSHPVPVAVLDPGEATKALILALRVDPDAGGGEIHQERVEVVDAVVDHHRLIPLTEVGRVHREWIPGRHARPLRHFVLPPEHRPIVADLDAQVLRVPGSERLRVRAP